MQSRKPLACIGGTFDPLHDGHKALLKRAFEIVGEGDVVIGLTSDEMAGRRRRVVLSYAARRENLSQYIKQNFKRQVDIVPLKDPYGLTLSHDFDFIIVSPETLPMAEKINLERRENGKNPIKVIKVDYVLAEDGGPISSTRIKKGEIDVHGKVIG